jgi:hypothetical protein
MGSAVAKIVLWWFVMRPTVHEIASITTPIANLEDPFARSLWLPSMSQKYVPVDDRPLPRRLSQ